MAVLFALSLSSCGKEPAPDGDGASQYDEQHWDWGDSSNFLQKQNSGGFTLDTAWDGDTTIFF